jgi:polyferredoxin
MNPHQSDSPGKLNCLKSLALVFVLFVHLFSWAPLYAQTNMDEFVSLDESTLIEGIDDSELTGVLVEKSEKTPSSRYLIWVIYLSFTLLAAVLVRYRKLRYTRHLILLASLVYFGFFTGGCPCVISAFQNLILFMLGVEVHWESLAFMGTIIVLTYLFGRIWCGWVCHLGAFQEFLYNSHLRKLPFLQTEKTQKILKNIRILLFVALIAQLVITKENLFIHIDPFKVAFNLSSYYVTGWILLALVLISSLYIYRPFCQAVCPIGLMLSWVAKIPGASILTMGNQCNGCKKCSKICLSHAIREDSTNGGVIINHGDCIGCGSCLDDCRNQSIHFGRKPLRPKPVEIPEGLKN